jgi:3-deoxy-D-manno-octulosonic-acid transferase
MLSGAELWLYKTVTRLAGRRVIKSAQTKWNAAGIVSDRFQERLGVASETRKPGRLIWLHARNVISLLPLLGLIKQLNEQELGLNFLVTTRRQEEIDALLDRLPANTVHQFLPIDLEQPVQDFLKHWSPDIAIIAGGEFWPRLLTKLHAQGVLSIAVNTNMTARSYRRWQWVSGLAKLLLNTFGLILAQDQPVAQKLKRLGAHSGKIRVTGLLSDAKKLMHYDESLYSGLSSAIGNRSVWLSATTHRDEEDVVVNAHKIALRRNRRLLLILHTCEEQRGARIAARHENKNLNFALQEKGDVPDDMTDVYVTDQMENLATYLRLASVTFCGGTLSTGDVIDPYHPATMGSAIIQGPACDDFEQEYNRYREAGATRLVRNGRELAQTLNAVVAPDVAATMAHAAWEISSEGGEVSGIVISEILEMLAKGVPTNEAA